MQPSWLLPSVSSTGLLPTLKITARADFVLRQQLARLPEEEEKETPEEQNRPVLSSSGKFSVSRASRTLQTLILMSGTGLTNSFLLESAQGVGGSWKGVIAGSFAAAMALVLALWCIWRCNAPTIPAKAEDINTLVNPNPQGGPSIPQCAGVRARASKVAGAKEDEQGRGWRRGEEAEGSARRARLPEATTLSASGLSSVRGPPPRPQGGAGRLIGALSVVFLAVWMGACTSEGGTTFVWSGRGPYCATPPIPLLDVHLPIKLVSHHFAAFSAALVANPGRTEIGWRDGRNSQRRAGGGLGGGTFPARFGVTHNAGAKGPEVTEGWNGDGGIPSNGSILPPRLVLLTCPQWTHERRGTPIQSEWCAGRNCGAQGLLWTSLLQGNLCWSAGGFVACHFSVTKGSSLGQVPRDSLSEVGPEGDAHGGAVIMIPFREWDWWPFRLHKRQPPLHGLQVSFDTVWAGLWVSGDMIGDSRHRSGDTCRLSDWLLRYAQLLEYFRIARMKNRVIWWHRFEPRTATWRARGYS